MYVKYCRVSLTSVLKLYSESGDQSTLDYLMDHILLNYKVKMTLKHRNFFKLPQLNSVLRMLLDRYRTSVK